MMNESTATLVRPRLGFVGVGWIGLNRMRAVLRNGCVEAAAVADPNRDALETALEEVPDAEGFDSLDALLEEQVDAVVIATPSGLHADQAVRALNAGKAVFCQKPLGCTADECRTVVEAARRNDRLLGVDFSYRFTSAMHAVREAIRSGAIGDVYAADLIFHNAYGPDKSWSINPQLAGGGCVIDLGIHLVDLLFWTLGPAHVQHLRSALFREGRRLDLPPQEIEDYAQADLELAGGAVARLACSWHFSAGRDAVIEASFYGREGSVSFCNVDGSFYDFRAEIRHGSECKVVDAPPDDWSGRAAAKWAERLSENPGYDAGIEEVVAVAESIDRIYGR